jgi:hypothetical protein
MSIELEKPQQAAGSPWNVSNFHWEEQNLDKYAHSPCTVLIMVCHRYTALMLLAGGGIRFCATCCSTSA